MAGKDKAKYMSGITEVSEVAYAWLDKPQAGFKPNDAPKYSVTLKMDPENEDVKKFAKAVAEFTKGGKVPITRDKETNWLMVKFHSLKPVVVVDSQNTMLPAGVLVGKGSMVRVQFNVSPYEGFGGGYTFYFNGVQVIKLVERAATVSFLKTDGYVAGDAVAKEPAEDQPHSDGGEETDTKGADDPEDSLPY